MTMAICVIVASVATSALVGLLGTTIYRYDNLTSATAQAGFHARPYVVAVIPQILLGSVFGAWALIEGLVAAVTNRGRHFGVAAIIVASAAPILSVIVWAIFALAAGHYVSA